MRSIRRLYVKKKYWFVVNDLRVDRYMEYDYKGIYPTLYQKKTKNYERRVKNNYYDEGGLYFTRTKESMYIMLYKLFSKDWRNMVII